MISEQERLSFAIATPIRCTSVGASAVISDHPGVFERIFAGAVTVCIWNRQPDPIGRRVFVSLDEL